MSSTRYKESPGVVRLKQDEARKRTRKISPWLAEPDVIMVPVPVHRKPKPKPVVAAQQELL